MKVPTAQLLATNGSATTPNVRRFAHNPASAKRVRVGRKCDRGTGQRTDAETAYDADADSTRDSAQETVSRARNFANTLQVIVGRQSLLAIQIHVVEHVSKKHRTSNKKGPMMRDGRAGGYVNHDTYLESLTRVGPVLSCCLSLVDWAAWSGAIRSGRWVGVF